MNKTLHTKFGTARIDNTVGYYRITSKKEGNNGKLLHRLIFEDFYGWIPKGYIVHHINENKLDNCVLNLKLMRNEEHAKLHATGENNPFYNRTHSDKSKEQMSISHTDIPLSDDHKQNISKSINTTGYYRVTRQKCKTCKQGFVWAYLYSDNGKRKRIASVSLEKLEKKVKTKGLTWIEFN